MTTAVVVVCEGQTEEAFVNRTLTPALAARHVLLEPRLVRTSRRSAGGALNRERVLRFLRNTLRQRTDVYVTTFFDLYGLSADFPGRSQGAALVDPHERAAAVETEFHATVVRVVECRPDRFLPHIQPYEFESLLFSDPGRFAAVEPAWQPFVGALEEARRAVRTPEHVNEGQNTHPSARLARLLRPRYDKVRHGAAVSAEIGVDRIRAECRHFDRWLTRLEALRDPPDSGESSAKHSTPRRRPDRTS